MWNVSMRHFKDQNRLIKRLVMFLKVTKLGSIRAVAAIQGFGLLLRSFGPCDNSRCLHEVWRGYCQKLANILSHIRNPSLGASLSHVSICQHMWVSSHSTADILHTDKQIHQAQYVPGLHREYPVHISKRLQKLPRVPRELCLLRFSSSHSSNLDYGKQVQLLKKQ